jgi:hypothetical protein
MIDNKTEQTVSDAEVDSIVDNKKLPPFRDFQYILNFVTKVYNELGDGLYHSKEDIAKVNNLAVNSIKSILSTAVQFKLLELKHGTGYKPTEKFSKIQLWSNEEERKTAIIESLRSQDLYSDLFNEYSGKVLPTAQGLTNFLIRKYGYTQQLAQKATETFYQDLRSNNLLNGSNVLGISTQKPPANNRRENLDEEETGRNGTSADEYPGDLIEIIIPLKNTMDGTKRKAVIKLPEDYSDKDIDRIAKIVKAYKIEEDEKGTD